MSGEGKKRSMRGAVIAGAVHLDLILVNVQ